MPTSLNIPAKNVALKRSVLVMALAFKALIAIASPTTADQETFPNNVAELEGMNFAFIAMEAGTTKKVAAKAYLSGRSRSSMSGWVYLVGDTIGGRLRATTATAAKHDHLPERYGVKFVTPIKPNGP
jgi:hypothetical protein